MKRTILTGILAFACVPVLMAQQGQAPSAGKAAPPALTPEQTALSALVSAQRQNNPDAVIKAAEDFVTNFPNSQYKEAALGLEATAYQMKGDSANAQVAWGRVIEANPKSIQGNLKLGGLIAQATREKDLDRDDQLAKSEKYLNTVIDILKTSPKPNPQMTDADWDTSKKRIDAEAHNDLGLVALTRATANKDTDPQKYAPAVSEFQTATSEDPEMPTYSARLAATYQNAGRSADAAALCDKLLADPQLDPQIKNFVNTVKAAAAKGPAAPAK